MMDLNFNYKTEGYLRIAKAVEPVGMTWLEMDTHDAQSLALIRRSTSTPIASCETLCERRDFKPFFEAYAMDVAIVDVIWNGYMESLKIAAMAEVYEMNVAPHNFYGHLSSVISAHFCAAVPNLRIMETDVDAVPWRDELVDAPPVVENGEFVLPTRPAGGEVSRYVHRPPRATDRHRLAVTGAARARDTLYAHFCLRFEIRISAMIAAVGNDQPYGRPKSCTARLAPKLAPENCLIKWRSA